MIRNKSTLLIFICLLLSNFVAQAQTHTIQEADSLHQLGRTYLNDGKLIEGRKYTLQAMEVRKNLLGEVSCQYITSLNNYAMSFAIEKNYSKAAELQEHVMELCAKLKKPHKDLGMYTVNMTRFSYLCGNKEKAVKYGEQALPLVDKFGEMYELLLNILGEVYTDIGNEKDIQRIMALTDEHNKHELSKDCHEPKCMLEKAQYYMAMNDNANAKDCFLKVLSMPMEKEMKEKVYNDFAKYLFSVNDYVSGTDYLLSAANIRKELDGNKKTETYANIMNRAGIYSYLGGNYQQAIGCYSEAIDIYAIINNPEAIKKSVECYNDQGNAYSALHDYTNATICFQKVVSYYESTDKNSEAYPKALLRVATAEKFNKEYDNSIEHYKQAMSLFEKMNMSEEYTNAANSLKLCYAYAKKNVEVDSKNDKANISQQKKLDKIIDEELKSLNLTKTYFSKMAYAKTLGTIAGCYKQKKDYTNALTYYKQYVEALRNGVRDEFRMQSESERMTTWMKDIIFNIKDLQSLLLDISEDKTVLKNELPSLIYDIELLSKGVLLKSSIEFEKVISLKGDAKLKKVYEQSKQNEEEIVRLRQNPKTEDNLNKLLKLLEHNKSLQLQLYKGCAEFADFTNYISYGWRDVQREMKEKDVAIEFVAIKENVFDKDNEIVALVLTKEKPFPIAIPICTLEEAKRMKDDNNLFEKQGNPVWGALSTYLSDRHRIFFSPDEDFNSIGIEYLLYNGLPLSEQYEVYRLSSTKEICYQHDKTSNRKVAMFGDVNYNDVAMSDNTINTQQDDPRSNDELGDFADLTNTRREINEVQSILKENKVQDILRYTGEQASSVAFKNLTNSNVNILHIATHGMYKNVQKSTDIESMTNSFLVFAGANVEKGCYVTAADVATMNLRQCDLVVLSACETGLGKNGEDGVFGLQRGFKNAGVHTLMMSLKNVYDESTAEIMISFYKHYMDGLSKREALVKAQQEIRNEGYKDAKHWASFILLDAY